MIAPRLGGRLVATIFTLTALTVAPAWAVSAAPLAPAAPVRAGAAGSFPQLRTADPEGASEFGACLRGKKTADVVLLVDESGSLKESDPNGQRVIAAGHLIEEWKVLTDRAGVTINVQPMGFSGGTSPGAWRSVADANAELKADVEAFAAKDTGAQTDYWMALNGARESLAQHAPSDGTCQAIVWFSDGKLDAFSTYSADGQEATKPYLSQKVSNEEATSAAGADLCRPGGLVDQLRSSTISLFGIGLNAGTSQPSDFDLMKALAAGGAGPGGSPCGAVSAQGKGWFKLATDVGALIESFDQLIVPDATVKTTTSKICQGAVCTEFPHAFVLDNSLTWVHVLARSEVPGLELYVVPPGEPPVRVAESFTAGKAQGTSKPYDDLTTNIDLIQPTGDWVGQWSVVFVDPTKKSEGLESRTSISMTSDLTPTIKVPDNAHAGDKIKGVTFGLKRGSGDAFDPASLKGSILVNATFKDSTGQVFPLIKSGGVDVFTKPLDIDLAKAAPGRGSVAISTAVTTAPATVGPTTVPGTAFQPTSAEYAVSLLPPLGFPTVKSGRLNFGRWAEKGGAKLTTSVQATGPGCVWLGSSKQTGAPEKAGKVSLTGLGNGAKDGVCLAERETKDIPVTLTTDNGANGGVTGSLTLKIAPKEAPDKAKDVVVTYTANLAKPPNTTGAWGAGVGAFLLGLGIPLLMMYALKWRSSVIKPHFGLLGGELPVTVTPTGISRDGGPQILQPTDLRDVLPIPMAGSKEITVGRAVVRTRMGLSPITTPTVVATIPGMVGVSSIEGTPSKDGSARLPLALANEWALFHDPAGPSDQAVLLLFAGAGGQRAEIERRILELGGEVTTLVARIRAAAGAPAEASSNDPFGAGPGAGPVGDPFANPTGGLFGGAALGAAGGGLGAAAEDPFAVSSGSGGAPEWGAPAASDSTAAAWGPPATPDPSTGWGSPQPADSAAPSWLPATPTDSGTPAWMPSGSPTGTSAETPPAQPTPSPDGHGAPSTADPFSIDLSDLSFDDPPTQS